MTLEVEVVRCHNILNFTFVPLLKIILLVKFQNSNLCHAGGKEVGGGCHDILNFAFLSLLKIIFNCQVSKLWPFSCGGKGGGWRMSWYSELWFCTPSENDFVFVKLQNFWTLSHDGGGGLGCNEIPIFDFVTLLKMTLHLPHSTNSDFSYKELEAMIFWTFILFTFWKWFHTCQILQSLLFVMLRVEWVKYHNSLNFNFVPIMKITLNM